jgi:regulator of telomere elongation helicase 1
MQPKYQKFKPQEAPPKDYDVPFRFDPYHAQTEFITSVLHAIHHSQNALIESPTGTGKTLGLLTAALTYQRENPGKGIKIIYLARTHQEVDNVSKELKLKTEFRPKLCILASKLRFCLKFPGEDGVELKCKDVRKENACEYLNRFDEENQTEQEKKLAAKIENKVYDIEDFNKVAYSCKTCPYYYQRSVAINDAELIVCTYEYILNRIIRQKCFDDKGISLENSIIIFDEAHNVQESATKASSFEISDQFLQNCVNMEEIQLILIDLCRKVQVVNGDQLNEDLIAEAIRNLEGMEGVNQARLDTLKNCLRDTGMIRDIDFEEFEDLLNSLADLIEVCHELRNNLRNFMRDKLRNGENTYFYFNHFKDFMDQGTQKTLFSILFKLSRALQLSIHHETLFDCLQKLSVARNCPDAFRVLGITGRDADHDKIELHCVDPSIVFTELAQLKPRSLIFTSGTLRPFETFEIETGIKFDVCLANNHVIKPSEQVQLTIVTTSNPKNFKFTHEGRQDEWNLDDMGEILLKIARKTPNGILVSFASKNLMKLHIDYWRQIDKKILDQLEKIKPIFVEPNSSKGVEMVIKEYQTAARTNQGAIYMGVNKGRVFEGMDFPDQEARAVVIIGVPLSNVNDVSYKAKANSLEKRNIDPWDWSMKEAFIGVNQAIGRVVRHINDFGAIFLCDARFSEDQYFNRLSGWAKEASKGDEKNIEAKLKNFFAKFELQNEVSNMPKLEENTTSVWEVTISKGSQETELTASKEETKESEPKNGGKKKKAEPVKKNEGKKVTSYEEEFPSLG